MAPLPTAYAAPAPTPFQIDCSDPGQPGFEITEPGRYVLARAVRDCQASPAIRIDASNVKVDLRGLLVDGVDASGFGVLAAGDPEGVVVKNGTLTDWGIAVSLDGSVPKAAGLLLRSNRIGIVGGDGASIIAGNTVVDSTETGIIASSGTNGHTIKNNTVARNGIRGILAVSSDDNVIEGNRVFGNADDGIAIVQNGNDNRFVRNTVIGNGGVGIYNQPNVVRTSTIKANTVNGNGEHGMEVGQVNKIVRNRVVGNDGDGIRAVGFNRLVENVVHANAANGIFIDTSTTSRIKENRTFGNGLLGVVAAGFTGPETGTNKARSNVAGPPECDPTGLCTEVEPRAISLGKADPVTIDCGSSPGLVLDEPGRYVLTKATLDCSANPAVSITADDVTLGLGGSLIDWCCGGGSTGIHVAPAVSGAKITNGTVTDFESGIDVDGTDSMVKGVVARSNGFAIEGGADNVVRESIVARTTNDGIFAGTGTKVAKNTLAANNISGGGGAIAPLSGNTIRHNTVIGNVRSGISGPGGTDLLVEENVVIGSGFRGIGVNSDSLVVENTVLGNGGDGINVFNSDSRVLRNLVVGNGGHLIFGANGIWASDLPNKLRENEVRASSASGIFIGTPHANTKIIDNKAIGNGLWGIDADPFTGRGLGTNKARRNALGPPECNPADLCF